MIIYLLKVMLAMSLCLGLYHLFLADKKTFVFNRFYLLGSMLLSLEAPFFKVRIFTKQVVLPGGDIIAPTLNGDLMPVMEGAVSNPVTNYGLSFDNALMSTVFIVTGLLLVRFCKNLAIHIYKAWTGEVDLVDGLRIISSNTSSPYSFFNTLFLPLGMTRSNVPKEILHHERSHCRNLHSLDLIIMELVIALHWFNPLVYLYKKALRDNHEYTADHEVTRILGGQESYIKTLLRYTLPKNIDNQLILSFNHSSTKKRIQMITSQPKSSHPIFFASILLFSLFILGSCADLQRLEQQVSLVGLEEVYDVPINSSLHPEVISQKSSLLGVDPDMVKEHKKLYPRLVNKFSMDDSYYITYDGVQIENVNLSTYVDISASFQVVEVLEEDPLFGVFEYRVALLSPENHDLIKGANRKWSVEMSKSFRAVYPDGASSSLYDALKKQGSERFKIDTTQLPLGVRVKQTNSSPPPPPPYPIPEVKRPTQDYLYQLLDAKRYGVWIDNKRISNSSLKERTPQEFSYYHESALASNAVNYGKHTYQVNLMTNAAFEKWVRESKLFRAKQ